MQEAYSFGMWLRRRRKTLDMTQEDLARQVGISVTTVRKLEADERRPSRQVAQLLAEALKISPDDNELFIKVARAETRIENLNIPELELEPLPAHYTRARLVGESVHADAHLELSKLGDTAPRLPAAATPLIGREWELEQITQMLSKDSCRLLTITGSGGVGKTRLALAAAHNLQTYFPQGVYFISLTVIEPGESILPVIANALGLTLYGNLPSEQQLANFLIDHQVLLVLDNFEHVLGSALLLEEILRFTTQLKVLATSRERLNLKPEWVFELQGLPYPPDDPATHFEEFSAFQLFLQSAARARPGIDLIGDERRAAGRICWLLDGNPLAIELAAGWVRALSCEEISHEIRRNLDFLSTRGRDIPERQRSLRATFDYSWSLLPEDEQRALRKLSIFRGGFRRPAADQIAQVKLPVLLSLVEKSFIRRGEMGWYSMHELVRQYAFSHFQALTHEHIQTYDRHCQYYAELCVRWQADLLGEQQVEVMREIAEEYENVSLAWDWAVSLLRIEDIQKMTQATWLFHEIRGQYQEGMELFEQATEQLYSVSEYESCPEHAAGRLLGNTLAKQAWFLGRLGQPDRALSMLDQAVCLLESNHEIESLADARFYMGFLFYRQANFQRASDMVKQSLTIYRQINQLNGTARSLTLLGTSHLANQELELAEEFIQQSTNTLADGKYPTVRIENLLALAAIAYERRDLLKAAELAEEAINYSIYFGNRMLQARALRLLAITRLSQGQLEQADQLLEDCIEILRKTGDPALRAHALVERSRIGLQNGDARLASQYAVSALLLGHELGNRMIYMDVGQILAQTLIQQEQNEPALKWLLVAEQAGIEGQLKPMDFSDEWAALQAIFSESQIEELRNSMQAISSEEWVGEYLQSVAAQPKV